MKKTLLLFLLFLFGFIYITKPIFAQEYVTCDHCGYCAPQGNGSAILPTSLPGNWAECLKCIYPNISPDPNFKETLLIPSGANSPPTPYPGAQFTMLGCIKSNINPLDFIQDGPARSLSEIILNNLFSIVGGLAFLYLIYGAFLFMSSQGSPERIGQSKRVVYGAIAGLLFSLSAILIIRTLAAGVLKIPGIQ